MFYLLCLAFSYLCVDTCAEHFLHGASDTKLYVSCRLLRTASPQLLKLTLAARWMLPVRECSWPGQRGLSMLDFLPVKMIHQ